MSLLNKLLKKYGVESAEQLDNTPNSDGSPTERDTYENYKKILSADEVLTPEVLQNFLRGQIGMIEMRWKDLTLENAKKAELIPYHTVYKTLEQAISAPRAEREQLEAHLNQIIN